MPTGHTTPLPLSTWDRDTLRAIAVAYRRIRRLGDRDLPARRGAEAVYHERHPSAPETEAQHTVPLMISAVARDHPTWLWKGVGAGSGDCARAVQRLLEAVWRCVC
jgi:hypothetical protein